MDKGCMNMQPFYFYSFALTIQRVKVCVTGRAQIAQLPLPKFVKNDDLTF